MYFVHLSIVYKWWIDDRLGALAMIHFQDHSNHCTLQSTLNHYSSSRISASFCRFHHEPYRSLHHISRHYCRYRILSGEIFVWHTRAT